MASLEDIRAGLAGNLATVQGVQINPYVLSNATPPYIQIRPAPDGIEYHKAMGNGLSFWLMQVEAYVGLSGDIGPQKKLDEFLEDTGTQSVFAAIESDRTLAGAVDDLIVVSCSGYQEFLRADGGGALIGATWTVRINV